MRVLVVGAGEVGFHLAERLSEEGQDVVLIEVSPERAEFAAQHMDIMTVVGNGASMAVLEEAGVRDARVIMAVTSRDEVNLITCLAAKKLGVAHTVARISNREHYERGAVLSREQLGIDLMVNPERECAWETFQLLQSVAATDVAHFADGRVQLIGLKVREGAPLAGKTLRQLGREPAYAGYITTAIVRDGVNRIPRGEDTIEAGDQIYVMAPTSRIHEVPPLAGHTAQKLSRIMIAGGSEEGVFLAEVLEEHGVDCTLLDRDRRRCQEIAERLNRSLVLHGDATDLELLEMEGVSGIDGFVAATGNDETNLLSSLLAKSIGAERVVTLIDKFEYRRLVPRVGLDASVSPRVSTVNAILRYVRRGRVLSVASLSEIRAEAIEFRVGPSSAIAGSTLGEADFPDDSVVGAILRGNEIIIPRGRDRVLPGDDVIVFALQSGVPQVEKLFD